MLLQQAKDTLCSDGNSLPSDPLLSLPEGNQERGWTEKNISPLTADALPFVEQNKPLFVLAPFLSAPSEGAGASEMSFCSAERKGRL